MPENHRVNVLEQRVNGFDQTVIRVEHKIDSIVDTLNSLVRIEERQVAINAKLSDGQVVMQDHEKRIKTLEVEMPENLDRRLVSIETKVPGLVELRGWVIMGVLGGLAMIGVSLFSVVLK